VASRQFAVRPETLIFAGRAAEVRSRNISTCVQPGTPGTYVHESSMVCFVAIEPGARIIHTPWCRVTAGLMLDVVDHTRVAIALRASQLIESG